MLLLKPASIHVHVLAQSSIECRDTKTKVITLTNHKETDNTVAWSRLSVSADYPRPSPLTESLGQASNPLNQSKLEAKTCASESGLVLVSLQIG